jgi:hypothetical protein
MHNASMAEADPQPQEKITRLQQLSTRMAGVLLTLDFGGLGA